MGENGERTETVLVEDGDEENALLNCVEDVEVGRLRLAVIFRSRENMFNQEIVIKKMLKKLMRK